MIKIENELTKMLGINFPVIMAPMFLVSNKAMMEKAISSGIMGVFPSLNFRREGELELLLQHLNKYKSENKSSGNFGVNLIVQKTNPLYEKHLKICVENKVPFYITSLGNPAAVIKAAHSYGGKVFCDVTNLTHAGKSAKHNCDGFIAVGQGAGGHAGPFPLQVLVPALKENFPNIPVIAAGGIATGSGILSMLAVGASGVSIGTRFIASLEATVNAEYKNAIINSGMDNIVMTTRISGTPCTILNTPYAQKIGLQQNWFEKFLSRNPRTKRYFKMLVQVRGMKQLEKALIPGNHNNLWCAGQSVELIEEIISCEKIIEKLKLETEMAYLGLNKNVTVS